MRNTPFLETSLKRAALAGFAVLAAIFWFAIPAQAQEGGLNAAETERLGEIQERLAEIEDEQAELEREGFILDPSTLPDDEFFRAKVLEIVSEGSEEIPGAYTEEFQEVRLRILNGSEKGSEQTVLHGGILTVDQFQKVKVGETVVLLKSYKVDGSSQYIIIDHYRLNGLLWILAILIVLVIYFSRLKGVGAVFGLGFSIFILAKWIVPQILEGGNPITVALFGTLLIAGVSIYLAHGFTLRTSIAMLATVITLGSTLVFSEIFVRFAHLFGRGTDAAFYLQIGETGAINLRGLLLAGILIGTLGVLDDITTAQASIVGELRRANPNLKPRELYARALVVGKEHISSLVNTLVLAYAGASLPLFVLFGGEAQGGPLWMVVNSEMIAEEVVRTIIGSIALVLAVPVTTILAAHLLKYEKLKGDPPPHPHAHSH